MGLRSSRSDPEDEVIPIALREAGDGGDRRPPANDPRLARTARALALGTTVLALLVVPSTHPPAGAAAVAAEAPRVWIQAGHVAPREPGYRWQTGAPAGPFGNERRFTRRVSTALAARLRRAGIRARVMPGRATPWAARGDVFIAIHHDGVDGVAGVGHAHRNAREYYYRGDGAGEPRRTPYPDTVPHRTATSVNRVIELNSRRLARIISRRMAQVFTASNGARSGWDGVLPKRLVRVSNYYGFRRTRSRARVIVEVGAAGADDRFLRRTDLISTRLAGAIRDYLRDPPLRR